MSLYWEASYAGGAGDTAVSELTTERHVSPDHTIAELERAVCFNSHLLPSEEIHVTAGFLRSLREGLTTLIGIAREAHHQIEHLQHHIAHLEGVDHEHGEVGGQT